MNSVIGLYLVQPVALMASPNYAISLQKAATMPRFNSLTNYENFAPRTPISKNNSGLAGHRSSKKSLMSRDLLARGWVRGQVTYIIGVRRYRNVFKDPNGKIAFTLARQDLQVS